MAFSFNSLSDKLKYFYSSLDRQVKDRTRELADKNALLQLEIVERKRMEKAFRKSEERYRLLVEQSLQGLVIAQDNPVRLSFVSKPMEAITGYSREELEKFEPQQLMELIHPEDRETFFRNFKDQLSGKEVPPVLEYRIIHKTKGTQWVEIYSAQIEHEFTPATHTVFLDITERKRAEEALRETEEKLARSKKMESLGLLAGGVAHDLNNVLSGIVSYPELILLDLPEDSKLRKPIETIQESGRRPIYKEADYVRKDRTCDQGRVGKTANSDHQIQAMNNYPVHEFRPASTG